jgi:hypothetical protein
MNHTIFTLRLGPSPASCSTSVLTAGQILIERKVDVNTRFRGVNRSGLKEKRRKGAQGLIVTAWRLFHSLGLGFTDDLIHENPFLV